jgi:hypothetical protein
MKEHEITKQDTDALLKFLPSFSKPKREFGEWKAGEEKDGVIQMPCLNYDEDVQEFFKLVSQDCWTDRSYKPEEAASMLEDNELIEQANLEQIKTMLTFCVRGERFCDGHWLALLKEGKIVALLNRLKVIRDEM